jgi:phosphoglycerate kinase
MKYIKDLDFKNKRVLIRVDYNVPLKHGEIIDDSRIKLTVPTIEFILSRTKSKIMMVSHLGRPDGKNVEEFSLFPIATRLGELLKKEIRFIKDLKSEEAQAEIRNLKDGEIALGENLRFYPEEESNDEQFAINLCHNFGVFVNDAFSASHRAHASVAQIPRFKPSCAGLLLEKEIAELKNALNPPRRPALAIIGGAKIETKLPAIENMAKVYDVVLVGGKIAIEAKEKQTNFPSNVIIAEDFVEGNFDIGPKTIEKYKQAISAASFLVWNGPMGKFEDEKYRAGTKAVYDAAVEADAYRIAGGGETIEFINSEMGLEKFNFVSSGGGAMLEFLSGKKLPGIEALDINI